MSDNVGVIVAGLTGGNGILLFVLLILVGCYFLFKQTFGTFVQKTLEQSDYFVKNITDQLKNISEEVKKTREALIAMQQSQTHFDSRLEKVEDDLRRIKPL